MQLGDPVVAVVHNSYSAAAEAGTAELTGNAAAEVA